MERQVKKPDDDRHPLQLLEDSHKIILLKLLQPHQGLRSLGGGFRQNEFPDGRKALGRIELTFGAAQAYPLTSKALGQLDHLHSISVSSYTHASETISPGKKLAYLRPHLHLPQRQGPLVNHAAGAIYGNLHPFPDHMPPDLELLFLHVYLYLFGTTDAGLAHSPGDYGGMRGKSPPRREHTIGSSNALNIVRTGLRPDQNNLLTFLSHSYDFPNVKGHLASGCPRGRIQPVRQRLILLRVFDALMQKGIQLLRFHPHNSFLTGEQPFIGHINGYLHRRLPAALPRPGLEDIELARLHSKFHILHILEMLLQPAGYLFQFGIDLWHSRTQILDRARRSCS